MDTNVEGINSLFSEVFGTAIMDCKRDVIIDNETLRVVIAVDGMSDIEKRNVLDNPLFDPVDFGNEGLWELCTIDECPIYCDYLFNIWDTATNVIYIYNTNTYNRFNEYAINFAISSNNALERGITHQGEDPNKWKSALRIPFMVLKAGQIQSFTNQLIKRAKNAK